MKLMSKEKKLASKKRLHKRNRNLERYDLTALLKVTPDLKNHIVPNKMGEDSIDFSSPVAIRLLNQALLNHYYGIKSWQLPEENLCPPIPGRADYIHYIADLLSESNYGKIPTGNKVKCLDVGVGANCIYPIIGVVEYGWKFIGSDIDPKAIASAQKIVQENPLLKSVVVCKLQQNPQTIFQGVLTEEEKIDLSVCNPPFFASEEEAMDATRRKVKNLQGKEEKRPERNFGGVVSELICEGGEKRFIYDMIKESRLFAKNCFWFTTLVSKKSTLKGVVGLLERIRAKEVKVIPMGTSNKSTRIVAWTFLSEEERKQWRDKRWKEPVKKKSNE